MAKSEEPRRQFLKLDLWAVRRRTCAILMSSLVAFAAYAGILLLLYPASGTLVGATVLIVFEGTVGLAATHKYSELGAGTRSRLRFVDPSKLGSGWKEAVVGMHREEIARLFEKTYAEIDKHDSVAADDFNDVAWFVVLAYSVTSVGIAVTLGPDVYLVLGAAGLLLLLCGACYVGGYRGCRSRFLDEDVGQFEYHVMARLSAIDGSLAGGLSCVRWLEKGNRKVLSDVGFVVESPKATISYWLGMPSDQSERFEITGLHGLSQNLLAELIKAPIVAQSGWQLSNLQEESSTAIQILNPVKTTKLGANRSLVTDCTSSSAASTVLAATMSELLRLFAA